MVLESRRGKRCSNTDVREYGRRALEALRAGQGGSPGPGGPSLPGRPRLPGGPAGPGGPSGPGRPRPLVLSPCSFDLRSSISEELSATCYRNQKAHENTVYICEEKMQ